MVNAAAAPAVDFKKHRLDVFIGALPIIHP